MYETGLKTEHSLSPEDQTAVQVNIFINDLELSQTLSQAVIYNSG